MYQAVMAGYFAAHCEPKTVLPKPVGAITIKTLAPGASREASRWLRGKKLGEIGGGVIRTFDTPGSLSNFIDKF